MFTSAHWQAQAQSDSDSAYLYSTPFRRFVSWVHYTQLRVYIGVRSCDRHHRCRYQCAVHPNTVTFQNLPQLTFIFGFFSRSQQLHKKMGKHEWVHDGTLI